MDFTHPRPRRSGRAARAGAAGPENAGSPRSPPAPTGSVSAGNKRDLCPAEPARDPTLLPSWSRGFHDPESWTKTLWEIFSIRV